MNPTLLLAVYFAHPSSGALPARFRRQRILIVGCGDVGTRLLDCMQAQRQRLHTLVLSRDTANADTLRQAGARVLHGDLDACATLQRFAGIAHRVVHLAPPANNQTHWWRDLRTQALLRALRRRTPPHHIVYGSTSGVYGDCQGAWITEAQPMQPHTPRAHRRADAERLLRHWGRAGASNGAPRSASILRIPGIYAPNRAGGTPRERLLRGTPVLAREDDVYTNHIHADDLARAAVRALALGKPQRVINVTDDTEMKAGDYFDAAADLYGLPRPQRLPRAELQAAVTGMQWSFLRESRRLRNARMKRELRLVLRHPQVLDGLRELQAE